MFIYFFSSILHRRRNVNNQIRKLEKKLFKQKKVNKSEMEMKMNYDENDFIAPFCMLSYEFNFFTQKFFLIH